MSVVHAALDPKLRRRVAIKVMRERPGATTQAERLRREAQALARLSHDNVIVVHDVGEVDGQVFLAMELIDGGTLSAWLKQPRPWREVARMFIQAGRGLAAAHAAGMVHRDFKPLNVLLRASGRPVVTDFGLVRELADPAEPVPEPAVTDGPAIQSPGMRLTASNAVMGTPAYMAPEQLRGRPADERSDQFAFCIALYEGLYGVHPFRPADDLPASVGLVHAIQRPGGTAAVSHRVPSWRAR